MSGQPEGLSPWSQPCNPGSPSQAKLGVGELSAPIPAQHMHLTYTLMLRPQPLTRPIQGLSSSMTPSPCTGHYAGVAVTLMSLSSLDILDGKLEKPEGLLWLELLPLGQCVVAFSGLTAHTLGHAFQTNHPETSPGSSTGPPFPHAGEPGWVPAKPITVCSYPISN